MQGQIVTKDKAALRVERFDALKFAPRFEYGHMAQLADTCGDKDGSELGTGWCRLTAARIPWTIGYDEVLTVIEGSLRLRANGEVHELGRLDSIWLPSGTELVYEAESALLHYAVHPSKWPAE
jgi:ethanolamine utilization protein EutQ